MTDHICGFCRLAECKPDAPGCVTRCVFCGILRDGNVCARCAKRGCRIVLGVAYHAGGMRLHDSVRSVGQERCYKRTDFGDAGNAEPRRA